MPYVNILDTLATITANVATLLWVVFIVLFILAPKLPTERSTRLLMAAVWATTLALGITHASQSLDRMDAGTSDIELQLQKLERHMLELHAPKRDI